MMKSRKAKSSRTAMVKSEPVSPGRVVAANPAFKGLAVVAASAPTLEQVRIRAYELYLERGAAPGGELHDWIRAERELSETHARP